MLASWQLVSDSRQAEGPRCVALTGMLPIALTTTRLRATMQEKMEEQLYEWLVCSSNAYGAWIHVALQGGLLKATVMTLPMVFASSFVQVDLAL